LKIPRLGLFSLLTKRKGEGEKRERKSGKVSLSNGEKIVSGRWKGKGKIEVI